MAEDATTTEVEETEETTETEAQAVEETEETTEAKDSLEDLPEWAKREIENVRKEAAQRRIQQKELAEALAKAVSPEDFETLKAESAQRITDLERELALAKFDVPEDLLPLLDGKTAAQIEELAPTLEKYKKPAKGKKSIDDLSGGLDPRDGNNSMGDLSPEEIAKRIPRHR